MKTLCGLDCSECGLRDKSGDDKCDGCVETNGHPFGGSCVIATCCKKKGCQNCGKTFEAPCKLKERVIHEFNTLGINDMEKVTDLYALRGAFINLQYTLPSGQLIKFWNDDRVYLGNQIEKKNSTRCYGIAADENYLLVCEYGENGSNAEIIVYKKWR